MVSIDLLKSLVVIFSSGELGSSGRVVRRVWVPVLGLERCFSTNHPR